ncbi:uncharacterized protein METZ01_LOCUS220816, partial [marine metagenome]
VVIGVIPARLQSTRFPEKILVPIAGRPLIAHVMERALAAERLEKVVLAVDSSKTKEILKDYKFDIVMTDSNHFSGTDRVAEVVQDMEDAEIIINIQGDEPMLDPSIINGLVAQFDNNNISMATAVSRKLDVSDLLNPNVVKAFLNEHNFAIDFKRDLYDMEIGGVYRHLGIYGYRRNTLLQLAAIDPTIREKQESLEQLRALDNNISIKSLITNAVQVPVDTAEDLEKVSALMGINVSDEKQVFK